MLLRDHKENSQLYWWPKVKDLDVPLPKTYIVSADGDRDGKLTHAANTLGYPLFLRTDYTSLKHSWKNSALVQSAQELWTHAQYLKLDSAFQDLPLNAFVLRELLPLEVGFKAYSDMPVHKERRFFIKAHNVQCEHPYWPEEAFAGQTIESCREKLAALNNLSDADLNQLELSAAKVADAIEGYWSVDFAKSTDGQWYLLDMAMGEDSYHWKDCGKNKR